MHPLKSNNNLKRVLSTGTKKLERNLGSTPGEKQFFLGFVAEKNLSAAALGKRVIFGA
jgi:hypothetical protein